MSDEKAQGPVKATPQAMRLAEQFLRKYGAVVDEGILFYEWRDRKPDAEGEDVPDMSEGGIAGRMKNFVAAMRDVAYIGHIDAVTLHSGLELFSQEMLQTGEFSRHEEKVAGKAEDIYRRKHDIPSYVELTQRQQARVEKFRMERLTFSREMDATADQMMNMQSDLIPILRSLGIDVRGHDGGGGTPGGGVRR